MIRFFTIAASALFFATATAEARPLDDVVKSGFVTIFVYKNYQPYSWMENGEITGIDADIAREIAKGLGVELKFLFREADESVDDDLRVNVWKGDIIEQKSADIMLHVPYDRALEIRSESLAILFSPYFGEEIAVVHDAGRLPKVETFGSFVANPIAVEVDTASDFFLSNAFRGQLQNSIHRGRYFMDAVEMLENGEVEALMASRAQAEWVRHRNSSRNFKIAQPPAPGIVRTQWPIGIAVKHDSRDLGYKTGDLLDEMKQNSKLAEIFTKYGVQYLPPALE